MVYLAKICAVIERIRSLLASGLISQQFLKRHYSGKMIEFYSTHSLCSGYIKYSNDYSFGLMNSFRANRNSKFATLA